MWLKLTGSLLVVTAGTAIGFLMAWRYGERPRQIAQIISCIVSLKSYINYAAIPLPEALARCSVGINGPVAELFGRMAQMLQKESWLSPQEALRRALGQADSRLVLGRPELEALLLLGANLGAMNREEQQKQLDLVQHELEKAEREAIAQRDPNMKMYRYLGVCGSLAIVILLV
ncbi:stage III sporulation protein AB [Thermosinus carboxydivorans Nor1]|uniref:Stage III sporulation protein AB n=1 Tax=Thermosinus carboxydivorans Nor1 TaxID=401526 RepID=A1HQ77_9FIRM|nr:stage III sporulation protein AB [Thermosinus carboxydivorans]EAX47924.1 stage III sporulation protein AB [Thermosinus carboxydivorans Nor1]